MAAVQLLGADAPKISKPRRRTQGDFIEGVVRCALTAGIKDLSMQELKNILARQYDTAMDMSVISRVVNELVAAGRLVRDQDHKRACSLSGVQIQPISMPLVQGRMFL